MVFFCSASKVVVRVLILSLTPQGFGDGVYDAVISFDNSSDFIEGQSIVFYGIGESNKGFADLSGDVLPEFPSSPEGGDDAHH